MTWTLKPNRGNVHSLALNRKPQSRENELRVPLSAQTLQPKALNTYRRKVNDVIKTVVERAKGTKRVVLIDSFSALEATVKDLSTPTQRQKAAKVRVLDPGSSDLLALKIQPLGPRLYGAKVCGRGPS